MELESRKYVVMGIIISIFLLFIGRLAYLQLSDDVWKEKAERFTETSVTIKPPRGLIYDRSGELLASNQAVYDLMVIPNQTEEFDTLKLCNLLGGEVKKITSRLRHRDLRRVPHKSHVVVGNITPQEYAVIAEQLHHFPGFFGQPTTMRHYPSSIGALLLGEVREVDQSHIDNDSTYRPGDYIGNGGIEKSYEQYLRGEKGVKYFMRDNLGRLTDLAESPLDSAAQAGSVLTATIDSELQAYAEELLRNKKGCVVAIEPSTGEVLTLASSPSFDPNLLVGRNRGKNFVTLSQDTLKPLYNRATKGAYRPGSIFKMIQSLIALEQGVVQPSTRIHCNRSIIGCHGPHSYDDLEGAIQHSCNPYFREVMKRMVEARREKSRFDDAAIGLDIWRENIMRFGLGTDMGCDIPGIKKGSVPSTSYYDKIYGERRWAYSTIYSLSIGEGELLVSPIQMANLAAIIANRGWYIPPHTVSEIDGKPVGQEMFPKMDTEVSPEHFDVVINAMSAVVNEPGGTAGRAQTPEVEVCGKTGTVQNDPIPDHSVFMAFAPRENPQIAVAVYVEYAGFGGQWAAPISSLIIEKHLTGEVTQTRKEERILDAVILDY